MKVLWLVNFKIPIIAERTGGDSVVNEGWISGMLNSLKERKDLDLVICYPQDEQQTVLRNTVGSLNFVGYSQVKDNRKYHPELKETFESILNDENPDIIHLMGTEFPHCYSLTEACISTKRIDKMVVSIQGLVSIYAQHYANTLPFKIKYGRTIRDFIKNETVSQAAEKMAGRGVYEKKTLSVARHVIGRTDWDRACTQQLAPNAEYHFNNETLRDSFYSKMWSYDECEKHSIFFSQATNPIKGLHLMLEALPIVKASYPDAKLYVAGMNISGFPFYKISSYGKYLKNLIGKNKLENTVIFTGPLKEVEMRDRFLRSNVFVSSSLIENSPNSVGEAMILGVPCISSDVGGVKDLLIHGREGYIYQMDAPYMLAYYICKVFSMGENAAQLGNEARNHALHTHNKEVNAETLIDIYRSVCEK